MKTILRFALLAVFVGLLPRLGTLLGFDGAAAPACYLPARSATKVYPLTALCAE